MAQLTSTASSSEGDCRCQAALHAQEEPRTLTARGWGAAMRPPATPLTLTFQHPGTATSFQKWARDYLRGRMEYGKFDQLTDQFRGRAE